jgi:hypothetical protein
MLGQCLELPSTQSPLEESQRLATCTLKALVSARNMLGKCRELPSTQDTCSSPAVKNCSMLEVAHATYMEESQLLASSARNMLGKCWELPSTQDTCPAQLLNSFQC